MENNNVEIIKNKEDVIAVIIYNDFHKEGIEFFTPRDFSQQLAFISHKTGHIIPAHTHNVVKRDIHFTHETLFVKKGKLKVNFYDSERNYFESRVLGPGGCYFIGKRRPRLRILKRHGND